MSTATSSSSFAGFVGFVDALGGVDVELASPMAGYAAGAHHLDGAQALAFARDRMGTDDFFRMERAQILLGSILRPGLNLLSAPRWPAASLALRAAVDTDLPSWLWPRLALAILRAGPVESTPARSGATWFRGSRRPAGLRCSPRIGGASTRC